MSCKQTLAEIGQQLDLGIYPSVITGGIVVPNAIPASQLISGKENYYEKQRSRRPPTRPWTWPPRWQGQTRGRWTPNQTSSVLCSSIEERYLSQLSEIKEAYPHTKSWLQDEGLWILNESSLLPDLWRKAVFITAFSFRWPFIIRSWGFWFGCFSIEPVWIGPRHTNFPDGSVCAFEPADDTWTTIEPILTLLDIYTLWALRHHYLEIFGRWPGQQSIVHPYERILEQKETELCGCGRYDKFYGECCKKTDIKRDRIADAIDFHIFTDGSERKPPKVITTFMKDRTTPPDIKDVIS